MTVNEGGDLESDLDILLDTKSSQGTSLDLKSNHVMLL
jgi:hypothetical protein